MAYKMKGFPMHEGVSPMKQTNPNIVKVGPYSLDISTEEGARALEEFNQPSTRSTIGDVVTETKPKKKSLIQKITEKGKKVIKKASRYVPAAKKLISKNIAKLIPYAGIAATAYDIGRINRMMKDEDLGMGAAIKKYYLGVEDEQTWEDWKKKNR